MVKAKELVGRKQKLVKDNAEGLSKAIKAKQTNLSTIVQVMQSQMQMREAQGQGGPPQA